MQMIDLGHFPFNQNVWFEFLSTSSGEWNSIFQYFQKRRQPCKVYPNFRNFLPFFCPFNFAPGISRIFFDAVSKFSKVLVEYMESALRMLTICVEKLVILGRTQIEWFILVDVPFVYNYQCQANSGKTAMSKMDISGDESLQVQNHLWCDSCSILVATVNKLLATHL